MRLQKAALNNQLSFKFTLWKVLRRFIIKFEAELRNCRAGNVKTSTHITWRQSIQNLTLDTTSTKHTIEPLAENEIAAEAIKLIWSALPSWQNWN